MPRHWLLLAGLLAAAAATVGPLYDRVALPAVGAAEGSWPAASGSPATHAAAGPAVPLPLNGTWQTFANGDRVNRVLRDGNVLWSATEGGGLVRWDVDTGAYRQFLAPQGGLPSNDVNDIVKASDGRLWLATSRGLAVLNPATGAVTAYHPENSAGMPSRVVTALAITAEGKLWVGFGQEWDPLAVDPVSKRPGTFLPGGLARFDPASGAWDEETHAVVQRHSGGLGGETTLSYKTLPSENVNVLAIGSDGILWVGTRPYYLYEILECPSNEPSCQTGGAWLLVGGGLAARQGDTWANWFPWTNELSCYSPTINDLAADIEGRVWVATGGRGLMLMNRGLQKVGCKNGAQPYYVRPMKDLPGPRGNYLWSVDVAPDGRVWIGHGQSYDDGLGIGILQHNGTFNDSSAANQGLAWRFDDRWEFLNLDNGPVESSVIIADVDVSDGNAVVVATKDMRHGDGEGLRVLDVGARDWQPLTTAAKGLPSNQIAHVTWDAQRGNLWVSTRSRGIARFDGQAWSWWRAFQAGAQVAKVTIDVGRGKSRIPVDLPDQATFDAAFPSRPRYVRIGSEPMPFRVEQFLKIGNNSYLDVVPDVPSALKKGAAVYSVARGPSSDGAGPVCVGADGTVWAGGRETIWLGKACPREWGTECWLDGGLGRFDGTHWRVFDQWTKDSKGKTIPDQEVQSCALDKQGRLWVGTGDPRSAEGDGIAMLDPQTETWTGWRKTRGVSFAGDGVSGIDVDPVTGDIWASHHSTQFCEPPPFGGTCTLVRIGGGVSRWNGTKWEIWQKPAAKLAAFGNQGEVTSIAVDRRAGRVWAGGWDAQFKSFHWLQGIGINAAVNWCPLDCTNGAWQSKVWPDDGDVVALELDDDGHLWAATHRYGNGITPPQSGVKLYDGVEWRTYTPANSGLPSREITALASEEEGMWVGTRMRGISRYSSFVPPTPTPTTPPTATPEEATPTAGPTRTPTTPPSATVRPTRAGPDPRVLYLPFLVQKMLCVGGCPTSTAAPTRSGGTATLAASLTPVPPSATPEPTDLPPSATATFPPPTLSPTPAPPTATPSPTVTPSPTTTPTRSPGVWRQYTGQTLPNVRLNAVTGLPNGRAFMVGDGGVGYVWDGQELSRLPLNSQKNLRQIVFASETHGYVAADEGYLYDTRNGGQNWRVASTGGILDNWWAVGAVRAEEGLRGWVLGNDRGNRLFFDGQSWSTSSPDDRNSNHKYTDITMLSATSAIAIRGDGSGARIMTWNGGNWTPGPATGALFDMHVLSSTSGVAVGTRGSVWQLGKSGQWAAMSRKPTTVGEDLNAVHMLADDDIWAAGGRSQLFHWNGVEWTKAAVVVPQTPAIRALWMASDGSEGWAVGDRGVVLRYE